MVCPSVKVLQSSATALERYFATYVEVSLQARPRFGLGVSSIYSGLFVESVTIVPLGTMFCPRSHADPAELPLALLAGHVAESQLQQSALKPTHLQPPFFSMVDWHLVHSLVFACSQLDVSESSAHFFSHSLTTLHRTGL